jgi:hypothetical protein
MAYSSDKSDRGEFLRYNLGKTANINCNRSRDVGMILRPQVQTILDTTRYLLENDLVGESKSSLSCVIC